MGSNLSSRHEKREELRGKLNVTSLGPRDEQET
jgi:hypothetical protein